MLHKTEHIPSGILPLVNENDERPTVSLRSPFTTEKKNIAIDCDLPIFMNSIFTFQISFVKTYVFYNNLLE